VPGVAVLVIRAILRAAGETVREVPPLSEADTQRLSARACNEAVPPSAAC
jgi:hypothetical protein